MPADMAALGIYGNRKNPTAAEIRSIAHEPSSCHRERDFRSLNYFLWGKTLIKDNLNAAATGAYRAETRATAHISERVGNKNHDLIFLVALGGRKRRANPSGRRTETAWKGWDGNVQGSEHRPYAEYGNDRRDTPTEDMPTLASCRHCSSLIDTQLSNLTVGVGMRPEDSTGGNRVGSDSQPSSEPLGPSREQEPYGATMRRCQENWRHGVAVLAETYRNLEGARKPYVPEQLEREARAGSPLVQRSGGFVSAGIQNLRSTNAPPSDNARNRRRI